MCYKKYTLRKTSLINLVINANYINHLQFMQYHFIQFSCFYIKYFFY